LTRKLLEWLPAVAWAGVIFALSSQSSLPGPSDQTADFAFKKVLHVIAYGILALLLLFPNRKRDRSYLIAFVIAVLYAGSDEFHQSFVPEREGTLRDVGIDSFAAGLALLLTWWNLRKLKEWLGFL